MSAKLLLAGELSMGFYVAMNCEYQQGFHSHPNQMHSNRRKIVAVARTHGMNEFISVADTPIHVDMVDNLPNQLSPGNVIVGTLAYQDERTKEEIFILNRIVPKNVTFDGIFFPAEGAVRLTWNNKLPEILVFGRHAHRAQVENGQVVLLDRPEYIENTTDSYSWQNIASYTPWVGELLPGE